MATILVLPFELSRILFDSVEMTVLDTDGGEHKIRLFTAEEFVAAQHAAVDKIGHGEKVTLDRARELTQVL
jgi:hypothetical protein